MEKSIKILIDLSSKINAMQPTYATKLSFCARKVNVGAKKLTDLS